MPTLPGPLCVLCQLTTHSAPSPSPACLPPSQHQQPLSLVCPPQEMPGGEFSPTKVQVPFSLQDLWLINEAVLPIHSIVPNPHTLLAQIPEGSNWFTVLDLKVAFFCIPLHPDSQYLFAYENPSSQASRLRWTVSPQGFRESLHLFGQVLS